MLEFIPSKQVSQRLSEGWAIVSQRHGDYAALMLAPEGWQPPLLDDRKPFRACTVYGCNEKHHGQGYCWTHYSRVKRHGDPSVVHRRKPAQLECNEAGCTNPHRGRGLCGKHLQRAQKAAKHAFQCQEAA